MRQTSHCIPGARRARVSLVLLSAALAACTEKIPTTPATGIVTDVAVVEIVPDTASISVGQTRQFSALILDGNGNPVSDKVPTWTTSNPSVAVVSSSGLMLAKGPGLATITAKADERSGSAAVAVKTAP